MSSPKIAERPKIATVRLFLHDAKGAAAFLERMNLSLSEAARVAGVTRETPSRWKRGKGIRYDHYQAIAAHVFPRLSGEEVQREIMEATPDRKVLTLSF